MIVPLKSKKNDIDTFQTQSKKVHQLSLLPIFSFRAVRLITVKKAPHSKTQSMSFELGGPNLSFNIFELTFSGFKNLVFLTNETSLLSSVPKIISKGELELRNTRDGHRVNIIY